MIGLDEAVLLQLDRKSLWPVSPTSLGCPWMDSDYIWHWTLLILFFMLNLRSFWLILIFCWMCEFMQSRFIQGLLFWENLCLPKIDCLIPVQVDYAMIFLFNSPKIAYLQILCNLLATIQTGSFPFSSL